MAGRRDGLGVGPGRLFEIGGDFATADEAGHRQDERQRHVQRAAAVLGHGAFVDTSAASAARHLARVRKAELKSAGLAKVMHRASGEAGVSTSAESAETSRAVGGPQ